MMNTITAGLLEIQSYLLSGSQKSNTLKKQKTYSPGVLKESKSHRKKKLERIPRGHQVQPPQSRASLQIRSSRSELFPNEF